MKSRVRSPSTRNGSSAVVVAVRRADGPKDLTVITVALVTAVAMVGILAAGWQLGGLVLRVLGA